MITRRGFVAGGAAATLLPMMAARANEPVLAMSSLYNANMSFSDLALSHEGARVVVEGFMAPPLKARSQFYVLTSRPMAVCPLCEDEAEWPDDILAIYAQRVVTVLPYHWKIAARGRLELGTYTDPELGFVSRIRLQDASQDVV